MVGGIHRVRCPFFVLQGPQGLPASVHLHLSPGAYLAGSGSGFSLLNPCLSFARYSALKKHIYALEKQYAGVDGRMDDLEAATNERSTLLGGGGDVRDGFGFGFGGGAATGGGGGGGHPADDMFSSLLDRELEKIVRFYREQEAEVLRELYQLEADIAQIDAEGPSVRSPYDEFDEDEEDEDNLSPNAG